MLYFVWLFVILVNSFEVSSITKDSGVVESSFVTWILFMKTFHFVAIGEKIELRINLSRPTNLLYLLLEKFKYKNETEKKNQGRMSGRESG